MNENRNEVLWIRCPVCDGKTRVKVDKTTVLLNFPLFCPKCRKKHRIDVVNLKLIVHQ
ncbi:MAG: conjugal transfer protein [Clostridia bacterium]|nr:conjugal transfer protein [Clostridia bacterium]